MKKTPLQSLGRIGSVATLFLLSGVLVFTLQTATGWTNPNANPPTAAGALYYSNNNVGIYTTTPTSTLSVNGEISAMGHKVIEVDTPTNGKDAVNLDYLQSYVSAQGVASGTGGGSVVLYYKTINDAATAPTTCPAGWNELYRGYGPHFVGMLAYDSLYTNASGYQAEVGFGGAAPLGPTPPQVGTAYTLKAIGIGSDSVCSMNRETIVPMYGFYTNIISQDFSGLYADACGVFNGSTYCNRCVVCTQ